MVPQKLPGAAVVPDTVVVHNSPTTQPRHHTGIEIEVEKPGTFEVSIEEDMRSLRLNSQIGHVSNPSATHTACCSYNISP